MFNNFPPRWLQIPHREDSLFSVVFLFTLIVPLMFLTIFTDGFEITKFLLFLLIGGLATLVLAFRKKLYLHPAVTVVLVLFWILNLLTTIFSLDVINSVVGLFARYSGSMIFITGWVLAIVFCWTAIRNEETRRLTLIRIILLQGLAVAALGISQQFNYGYYGGITEQIRPIIPSFIGNQNFYAMYLLGAVAAVGVLLQQAQSRAAKYYYALSGVVVIFAIILSGSRGGMLGLAVTCAVYLGIVLWRKYSRTQLITILSVIVLSGLLYVGFHTALRADTLGGTQSAADYSTQTRYVIWTNSLQLIHERPWLGTGHGNFLTAFQGIGNNALSGNERFDDAHNLFLHLGVTLGIPATLLFLLLLGMAFYEGWEGTASKQPAALWSCAALAGVVVAACFNPVSISTWVLMAVAIAIATSYASREKPLAISAKVLFIIGGLVLMIFAACFATSELLSIAGKRAYTAHDNDRAFKDTSLSVKFNPTNSSAKVFLIGSEINAKQDPAKISRDIEAVIAQHPRAAGLYKIAGDLYYRLYSSTQDRQYLEKMNQVLNYGEQLEPNSSTLYGSSSYLYFKAGENDKALDSLNHLLSLADNEKYPYSWLLRAEIMLRQGDKEGALYSLRKASAGIPGQVLLKNFTEQVKASSDVSQLRVPVYFPDIDLQI